jgi:hypothetical protein
MASIQHVPSAAPPTHALPAVSTCIPGGTTLAELSYRDVATAGISPSGPTVLHDPDSFKSVTYKKKTANSTPPVGIAAVNKVKLGR